VIEYFAMSQMMMNGVVHFKWLCQSRGAIPLHRQQWNKLNKAALHVCMCCIIRIKKIDPIPKS